jgi:hypothetical protein
MAALKLLKTLSIRDITNVCGRVLIGSELFEGDIDNSMGADKSMPLTTFERVDVIGPYKDGDGFVFKRMTKPVLFAKDDDCDSVVCLSDINQGMIGDCWFLSAIDFTINHPLYRDRLQTDIVTSVNDMSAIKIKLYDTATGTWQQTYVDTCLPVNGDILPACVSVLSKNPNEIWPSMLEKGLAKMCGGYQNIEGGLMSEGMCFLHGGRGFFISSKDIIPVLLSDKQYLEEFVDDLRYLFAEGYGIFTAWEVDMFTDDRAERGLVNGHAYSVLDMKEVDGVWIFKLKNPWGTFEWKGKYSDSDDSAAAAKARTAFGMQEKDDGIFLISIFDLLGNCEGIDLFEPLDKNILSSL